MININLLPNKIRDKIPELEMPTKDSMIYLKYIRQSTDQAWYVFSCEKLNEDDFLFYAYTSGLKDKVACFPLSDLRRANRRLECARLLPIKREVRFKPRRLLEIEELD